MAGRDSPFGQRLAAGRTAMAKQQLQQWQSQFGDRLYLELCRTGREGEDVFNSAAVALADRYDLLRYCR